MPVQFYSVYTGCCLLENYFQSRHPGLQVSSLVVTNLLASQCVSVTSTAGRRYLHCAVSNPLDMPGTHSVWIGSWPFKICSPAVWNSLLDELHFSNLSLSSFQKGLKTFLFGSWRPYSQSLTYLLWKANRNSYALCRMALFSMTLGDPWP